MDFINDTNRNEVAMSERNLQAMTRIVDKPQALYYRTLSNTSIDLSTETSSTILDWIYDDNISTTDNYFTETATSDYENVTEVTLFNKNVTKPKLLPKKSEGRCECNILYKTCDINCCCDIDCTDKEIMLFASNCEKQCNDNFIHSCNTCRMKRTNFLENLFCISKTNLPDKRLTDIQFDEAAIYRFPRWRSGDKRDDSNSLRVYRHNDPIWLMSETRFYADIPMAFANNYCGDKRPIRFLKDEDIECIVKLQDLHMFQALKYMDSSVLSVEEAINTTKSETFHTNWTLVICDDNQCRRYNKTRDEPHCTDSYCNNIATTVHYIFYYNSKITKAVLKLYIRKVSMQLQFIIQRITVKFYLSNDPIESVIKLSGNPGYNLGLPIITSSADGNHTQHFFNETNEKRMLTHAANRNGKCLLTNITYNIIQFGQNKRCKCRLHIQKSNSKNGTTACNYIQNQILHLMGLNSTIYISPYGNPEQVSDDQWIRVQIERGRVHGVFKGDLICYNVIVRVGYVFVFEGSHKIVHVTVEGTAQNVTFDTEDASTVVTVDASFIELSKPVQFGAPHLSINLPKGFFVPNRGNVCETQLIVLFIALTIK